MKFIATILLITLFINSGYYCIYQIMIFRAKCHAIFRIRNGERSSLSHFLTLSEKEALTFDNDEIIYKGKLYDVIEKMITRDSVTFCLYPDNEEQEALTDLTDYFSSDKRSTNRNADKINALKFVHITPDQSIPRFTWFESIKSCTVSSPETPRISIKFSTRHKLIPTPPPRHFLT